MNQRILLLGGVLLAVVVVLFAGSVYTVHQSRQALILQFGNPVRVVKEPGLGFKLPFIQQVEFFERRVLDYDAPSVELILGDQRRLVVDTFTRYRIVDPLRFRQAAGNEALFRQRLEPTVFAALRSVLGETSLMEVLSKDRAALMNRIRDEANKALARFGVEIVDVRIKRADLPAENTQAIFRRMQTEREREAKELRAQGAEIAQRIRARADRERRVLIAEAQKRAEILRGEGDAEVIRIFAEAFGQDVDFFKFYRTMQAYRQALGDGQTSIVMSPQSDFFRFFGSPGLVDGAPGKAPAGADLARQAAGTAAAAAVPVVPAPAGR
ncbi:MAG: protease modulator HflC [Geminicoccaceae bacterium]|nr:protease modulator HflC [Geminicoccaceae bacterium]